MTGRPRPSWSLPCFRGAPDGVVLTGIQHAPLLKKTILNAATPVVEIWDLTPTPLDMLVGFSHEKVGETIGEYVLEKGYQRPGLLWAGDARAMLRKQGLCARLAKKGWTMRLRLKCRSRRRWRWGGAVWRSCSPPASLM